VQISLVVGECCAFLKKQIQEGSILTLLSQAASSVLLFLQDVFPAVTAPAPFAGAVTARELR
jgi:hypothetical protein